MGDRGVVRPAARLVSQQQPAADQATAQQPSPAPARPAAASSEAATPVRVIMGDDGDMLIVSRDPVAADTAKHLVEQIVPDKADVEVLQLKHAQASAVKSQLDTLLEHTHADDSSALATRPPLRIDPDVRTNRLLIQHASPRQMRLITDMVAQLDRPQQENERLVRQQRIYHAKRKRASEIAEVVKEVYRDLLSSSDKVFAGRETYQPFGYSRALAATTKSPEYQGLLSVGVDDVGNTLILSAPTYLMEEVMRLVVLVDATAGGETVAVVPLKSPAARESVEEALRRVLAKPE
jgi:type II secretory pathway component GspD/PulD (secretin)